MEFYGEFQLALIITIILALVGIALLYGGAKFLVVGASNIAISLGISKLVVGLTVVAIATGSPELLVSLFATIKGSDTISVGNIIGSNIINTLLILGISLLISPIKPDKRLHKIELPIMLIASVLLAIFVSYGEIPRWGGAILVAGMIATMWIQIKLRHTLGRPQNEEKKEKTWIQILWIALGAILLVFGSKLFIESAIAIAKTFSIPNSVIAVTLVALGTSLPELATCIYSARNSHPDLTMGNLIGSNIFNIFGVLGICALVYPLDISSKALQTDSYILLATAIILFFMMKLKKQLSWGSGIFLLLLYVGYTISII
ncbi:MAG: calcium/sodium antiporter [Rhabdochlamydiaceae bacterium]|nr:calcium/sodium antiporter [Candidatus Amphrikana amoebophyrae]